MGSPVPDWAFQTIVHFLLPSLGLDPAHIDLQKLGTQQANKLLHDALVGKFREERPSVIGRMIHDKWFADADTLGTRADAAGHTIVGTALYFLWEFTVQVPQADKIAGLIQQAQEPGIHKAVDPKRASLKTPSQLVDAIAAASAELFFPV